MREADHPVVKALRDYADEHSFAPLGVEEIAQKHVQAWQELWKASGGTRSREGPPDSDRWYKAIDKVQELGYEV